MICCKEMENYLPENLQIWRERLLITEDKEKKMVDSVRFTIFL